MKASSISLDRNISFLFKAPPGFGKTLAVATFALDGPTFLAYFDKKKPVELKTFFTEARFGEKAKIIMENIEYEIYGGPNANQYLNKVIDLASNCRYTTFITDSVTNLTAAAVNWSMGFRQQGGKKDLKANDKNTPLMIPDFDEYKTETSLISQAMDISKTLPCNVIWTAHPLPSLKIEGSGASIKVTKVNPIVTYGSKVAGMIPGNFTEIYQFSKISDYKDGTTKIKYIVSTEAIGDDYAKSPLLGDYVKEFDITDKLFYEVWRELLDKSQGIEKKEETITDAAKLNNPFQQPATKWKT